MPNWESGKPVSDDKFLFFQWFVKRLSFQRRLCLGSACGLGSGSQLWPWGSSRHHIPLISKSSFCSCARRSLTLRMRNTSFFISVTACQFSSVVLDYLSTGNSSCLSDPICPPCLPQISFLWLLLAFYVSSVMLR